jgi:ribosomal protein S18 acetylase RimI-like enzyme
MTAGVAKTRRLDLIAGHMALSDPATTVRPATPADEAFCRMLFHDTRGPHFALLGLSDEMLTTLLDQQFRAQGIGYAQSFPDAEYLMIELAGAVVGRLIAALERATEPSVDAADHGPPEMSEGKSQTGSRALRLIDIAILTGSRGGGIGTDVIETLGRAALAIGARRITLSVRQDNHRARRLYGRLGFVACGGEDHIRMSKPLA